MKRHLVVLATALLAVGLVSCSADQKPPVVLLDQSPTTAELPPQAPGEATPSARPKPPLTEFLWEIYGLTGSVQERTERERREHTQIEDQVASCMTKEGFEYTPQPFVPSNVQVGVSGDGVSDDDRSDREWVTQYGYGVSASPARPIGQMVAVPERPADPNLAYTESLSASQRAAYEIALYGEPATAEELEAGWDLSQGGCWGNATLAVHGVDVGDLEEFEPFFEATEEFAEGALSWDGISELEADWVSCMADRGHPGYKRQADAANDITTKETTLWQQANPNWATDRAMDTQPPMAALQALAEQERAVALIDLDCREQVDYQARYDAIELREETRFMTDHEADVKALRAASEQQDHQ